MGPGAGRATDNSDLAAVDWEPFFRTFRESGLSFVYQEKTSDGSVSTFNRFVREE